MDLEQFTQMTVHRLVLDPNTNSPIVVLQDEATGVLLPIWIGIFEAHSIAMKMEGVETPRPMTHDLLSNAISVVNGMVERIEVTDLVENTYFAKIYFQVKEQKFSLDSRPSDAIALALRATSPIFVANHVLDQSKIDPSMLQEQEEEAGNGEPVSEEERWERILKNFQAPSDPDKAN